MGLDQYAYARIGDQDIEIAYWRKHANLEGWMSDLYKVKTGDEEVFNCKELVLDKHDLKMLEQDYKNLATSAGFLWSLDTPSSIHRGGRKICSWGQGFGPGPFCFWSATGLAFPELQLELVGFRQPAGRPATGTITPGWFWYEPGRANVWVRTRLHRIRVGTDQVAPASGRSCQSLPVIVLDT